MIVVPFLFSWLFNLRFWHLLVGSFCSFYSNSWRWPTQYTHIRVYDHSNFDNNFFALLAVAFNSFYSLIFRSGGFFILKAKCDARWWSIDNVPIILSNIPHKPYLSAREFVLIVQSMWVSWWVRGRMNVDLYVNIVANNILFACVSMYIMSAMKCFFLLRR